MQFAASHRVARCSAPSKVRMRSTTRQFAQCYLILAHFQHSKFNTVDIYICILRIDLLTLGTLHCLRLHGCAVVCASYATRRTFAQCIIFLERTLTTWFPIWKILPKVIVFRKIAILFGNIFCAKILQFFGIPIVSIDKTICFGIFIKWIPKRQRETTAQH